MWPDAVRTFRKVDAGPMFDPGFRAAIAGAASWGRFAKQGSKCSLQEHGAQGRFSVHDLDYARPDTRARVRAAKLVRSGAARRGHEGGGFHRWMH
jgi:hypothetical protein